MAELAALKAEMASLKALMPQQQVPTIPEVRAAALQGRPAIAQPAPATFNNARKNAQYYKAQAHLYALSASEKAAFDERIAITIKAMRDAQNASAMTKKEASTYSAVNAGYKAAVHAYHSVYASKDAIKLEHTRYKKYYFGAVASQENKRFLIWRYYVFQFLEDHAILEVCKPTPIGLLNPHAYFATRRQGQHDFLNFVDKTQPAPKLPTTQETWPVGCKHDMEINEHIDDDNYDDWNENGDECAGCYYCNPDAYPEKLTPVVPLPTGHIVVLRTTTRAHSSGNEHNHIELYSSYEAASKAILAEFDTGGMAIEYWDENACYEDERGDTEPLPEPTLSCACKKFSPDALKALNLEGSWEQKLYGPYSKFCIHCPYELHISVRKIK